MYIIKPFKNKLKYSLTEMVVNTKQRNDTMNNENENDIDFTEGEYAETPWDILNSYFHGQHLERLVRHQVESYNNSKIYRITEYFSSLDFCNTYLNLSFNLFL